MTSSHLIGIGYREVLVFREWAKIFMQFFAHLLTFRGLALPVYLQTSVYSPFYRPLQADAWCYVLLTILSPPPGWCLMLCVTHHFIAPSRLVFDVMCYSPFCRPLLAGAWCCPLIRPWIVLCRETPTCGSQSVMEKKKNFSLIQRQLRTPKKPLGWWTSRLTQRL